MVQHPKILIDGYNLILRFEGVDASKPFELEKARNKLLTKLASYLSMKKVALTVVFDGADVGVSPRSQVKNGVRIIFSQPPVSADEYIKKIVQKESHRKRLTVVTSDRAVSDFAKTAGCQTLSSEAFHRRLEKMHGEFNYDDKFNHELSDDEVNEWNSLFQKSKE